MPRANRYFVPGTTYHLTHRCHDREFLLRFAVDRDAYRRVLWETKPRGSVWVLAYCLTGNHVLLLCPAQNAEGVSSWMQRAEGEFAQWYNRRKGRSGAFWEGRYQCTLIDGHEHCERCMTYIELNMVRAGVVQSPDGKDTEGMITTHGTPAERITAALDYRSVDAGYFSDSQKTYNTLLRQLDSKANTRPAPEAAALWEKAAANVPDPAFLRRLLELERTNPSPSPSDSFRTAASEYTQKDTGSGFNKLITGLNAALNP